MAAYFSALVVLVAVFSLSHGEVLPSCSASVLLAKNDSCMDITRRFQLSIKQLLEFNPNLVCDDHLHQHEGSLLCVNKTDTKEASCSKKVTIMSGDTCYNLSITYNTIGLWQGLQRINPHIDCDNLVIGTVACVRVGPETSCGRFTVAHKDDSCYKIATDMRMTLEDLHKLNPFLDCFSLQIGQMVCIKPPSE